MKAEEKAMEIAMKFDRNGETDNAKQCALICVDEIMKSLGGRYGSDLSMQYWIDVKQEIEKL